MQNSISYEPYIIWGIIISMTIYFFNLFVEKHNNSLIKLLSSVLGTVWILISIISLLYNFYSDAPKDPLSLNEFIGSLAFNLPVTLFIGGITFAAKYIKRNKK